MTRPVDERLSALLDGELTPPERERLETGLRSQPEAAARLEALRVLERALGELPRIEPQAGFEQRFRERLEQALAPEHRPWRERVRARLQARGAWIGAGALASAAAALFLALWLGRTRPPASELEFIALLEDPETVELLRSEDVELLEVLEILEAWDGVEEG